MAANGATPDPIGTQYEYATVLIEGNLQEGLNQMGAQGWCAWAVLNEGPKGGVVVSFRRVTSRIVVPV